MSKIASASGSPIVGFFKEGIDSFNRSIIQKTPLLAWPHWRDVFIALALALVAFSMIWFYHNFIR